MIQITDTGLEKNSFDENYEYVQTVIKGEKGDKVDFTPTGPWGQITAILTKFISDIDDQQEEIYLSRDPDNVSGIALDKLAAETGTVRKQASKTVVQGVLLKGDIGTLIPEGKQAGMAAEYEPPAELYFILDADVTISKSYVGRSLLSFDAPSTGKVYGITINGVEYSYTALGGDTLTIVVNALIALIVVGEPTMSVLNIDDELQLQNENSFILSHTSTVTLAELWSIGSFTASIAGAYDVPAGALTEIITPVTGWDSVYNPSSGIIGLEKETDAKLKIRRKNELIKGKATDAAIQNAINELDNVSSVSVTSNRSDETTVEGVPPHSFEAVVTGGLDDDIAQAIFDNMPSGIRPYGTTSGTAVDDYGQTYTIPFSRPSITYIHVRFTRTAHPEVSYPSDGDALVQAAVLKWVIENITMGTDVVRQMLETPFFSVPGSSGVTTEIAETVNPGDTPTWGSPNYISIPSSGKADFSADRIFIVSP